ncbi:hypothetical protein ES695_05185 [Candidatus Atribacteria bacterium 1244-E10-H5-B2]|nr:MAG: hypothetical protein ES695_05185 [Candidatus Atribacteria bacterium 1244-E10-H5-B2]
MLPEKSRIAEINNWYKELIADLKKLAFEGIVKTKHSIGKRIIKDEFKLGKPEYGSKQIENLAKDLDTSKDDLWACIRFAKKYKNLDGVQQFSWRYIWHELLPAPKEESIKDNWLRVYDIWNFAGLDYNFGIEYPGNIPAGIVLNVLYYYTKENDLVIDPMSGGGITIDCCKYLNRRCLSYDIKQVREDIKINDILKGYPNESKDCDLIFLDPPYYKKKELEYGDISISALDRKTYLQSFDIIAKESYKIIKKNGYLALLMEPYIDYENSSDSIWLYDYINRFLANNWSIERIYDVPQTSQRYQAYDISRAKKNKIALTLRRELIIFKGER